MPWYSYKVINVVLLTIFFCNKNYFARTDVHTKLAVTVRTAAAPMA